MEILMIILTVLKWIGLILLSVLGLVLICLLVLLLWPITYRAKGSYDGVIQLQAAASWFLGLLKVQISYSDTLDFSVKILGRKLFPMKPSAPKKSTVKKEKNNKSETKAAAAENEEKEQTPLEVLSENAPEVSPIPPVTEEINEEIPPVSENKHRSLEDKISEICSKIGEKITGYKTKYREVEKNISYYKNLLQKQEVQHLLQRLFKMLGRMLKHICPRKLSAIAHIGMEDPAVTGQIMAIQGLLYPWMADKIVIIPYFEEEKKEGQFQVSGHIMLGVLLICVLKIVLNRDFLKLIRILRKKEDKKNGRAQGQ